MPLDANQERQLEQAQYVLGIPQNQLDQLKKV